MRWVISEAQYSLVLQEVCKFTHVNISVCFNGFIHVLCIVHVAKCPEELGPWSAGYQSEFYKTATQHRNLKHVSKTATQHTNLKHVSELWDWWMTMSWRLKYKIESSVRIDALVFLAMATYFIPSLISCIWCNLVLKYRISICCFCLILLSE